MPKPQFDNTNKGAIWKIPENERYTPQSPQYHGSINIDGKDYKFVGWRNESQNPNAPGIRLQLKRPQAGSGPPPRKGTVQVRDPQGQVQTIPWEAQQTLQGPLVESQSPHNAAQPLPQDFNDDVPF